MDRRNFLKTAALGIAGAAHAAPALPVVIAIDSSGSEPSAPEVKWAIQELRRQLDARSIPNRLASNLNDSKPTELCVVVAGPVLLYARPPRAPEGHAIAPTVINNTRPAIAVSGHDSRGLTYAILELADQVRHTGSIERAHPLEEQPANRIRSIIRPFVSEVEDKPWFYDRDGWREYLTMLATNRFNRFSLTFGIGYDFTREVRDSYFHFPYPFLVKVPGYDVQVPGVSDSERQRNLDMLRFIGEETVMRGMHFQVGIWTHAYNFDDSPNADRKITGLNPQNHAQYCRDALRAVLEACPSIGGLTLRTHGESGVPEESYPFWKTVFEGVTATRRPIELDLHAKGLDWTMIELTQATGMPVTVSPKYWAEHMGLPYHQASIRQLEMPKPRPKGDFFALSSGSRSFLRYGYGDLLKSDRKYKVLYRMWPGTQRLLLWGDPVMAAAYSRASSFCGSDGVELCEPLSFKGRKGSGLPGGRTGYADSALVPKHDWEKYAYTYRVWGRLLYNPATDPEVWRREMPDPAGEKALAASSRILPLITTAHMPSAANAIYWPEIYTNQSIVIDNAKSPYSDTPSPKRFGTVSPLDPALFAGIDEHAQDLLSSRSSAKYSPIHVASWLEELAAESDRQLALIKATGPAARRLVIDTAIQNNIGRFFAAKFRAGVLFAICSRTGDPAAHAAALRQYRAARDAWQGIMERASGVYRDDLSFGYAPYLRGSWRDRLAAIDADIAAMEAAKPGTAGSPDPQAIRMALATVSRPAATVQHTPVTHFRPGQPLVIKATAPSAVTLRYRHVNQSETWQSAPMDATATIPASYTATEYPIQYYFESAGSLYPGLPKDFSHAPYFVVERA
ncbi:MAG TPA: hypothetical protein VHB50_10850 [Bryobacteraceae bacterium]|nr:hypothetical protein [Bryobacteraceae bacterium]